LPPTQNRTLSGIAFKVASVIVFLAMAASFNEKLGFLILDDVINSFDVEHRGRLAELLADGFSDWQLIVLTHDQQFFEHLSRRAPSYCARSAGASCASALAVNRRLMSWTSSMSSVPAACSSSSRFCRKL